MKTKRFLFLMALFVFTLAGCANQRDTVNGLYVDNYRMSEEEERGFILAGGQGTSLLYQVMTPKPEEEMTVTVWLMRKGSDTWEEVTKIPHRSMSRRPMVVLRNDLKDVVHGVYFFNSEDYALEDSVHIGTPMPEAGPYEYRVPSYLTEGYEMKYGTEYSLVANYYTDENDGSLEENPPEDSMKNIPIENLYYEPERVPADKVEETYLWTLRIEPNAQ